MFHDLEGRGVLPIVSEENFALHVSPLAMPKPRYSLGTLEHWNKTSFFFYKSYTYLVPRELFTWNNWNNPVGTKSGAASRRFTQRRTESSIGTGFMVTGLTRMELASRSETERTGSARSGAVGITWRRNDKAPTERTRQGLSASIDAVGVTRTERESGLRDFWRESSPSRVPLGMRPHWRESHRGSEPSCRPCRPCRPCRTQPEAR